MRENNCASSVTIGFFSLLIRILILYVFIVLTVDDLVGVVVVYDVVVDLSFLLVILLCLWVITFFFVLSLRTKIAVIS